ncbi:Uncharacterised protein [uncultured archaeon]|nr:Uncharacterised protein [uncultured archaeon]
MHPHAKLLPGLFEGCALVVAADSRCNVGCKVHSFEHGCMPVYAFIPGQLYLPQYLRVPENDTRIIHNFCQAENPPLLHQLCQIVCSENCPRGLHIRSRDA